MQTNIFIRSRTIVVVVGLTVAVACIGIVSGRAAFSEDVPSGFSLPKVMVDPRVELLSVLFRLAGNPEYCQGRVDLYTSDVEEYFGPFRDHAAVKLARQLRRTRGVSFDAVMSMAVHVTDTKTLAEKIPFDPRPSTLDARWRPDEAREFLHAARQFAVDASFQQFVDAHQPLYELATSRMRVVLEKDAGLEWFDRFFGQRPGASFSVALGLLNGGSCYGARCLDDNGGGEELYCVLGVWSTDALGKPRFDKTMLPTVVHEFCHSYTNPIVDRHAAELESAGNTLFSHVAKAMRRQAYGTGKTLMYESLVRACVVRYLYHHAGPAAARKEIERQKQRQFLWIEELAELLGRYEKQRDRYPTLEAFFPRIVVFFDDYAGRLPELQREQNARRPRVKSMNPANGASDVEPGPAEIRVVFDRPMRDGSWSMVGGGIHFPEILGKPSYDKSKTVWNVSVKLKPDWTYRFRLNAGHFRGFQSRQGEPLESVEVEFTTGKGK